MLTFLRSLALGAYPQYTGWKNDGDRRLSLSAVLTVTLYFNLYSVRVFVQDVFGFGDGVSGTNMSRAVTIVAMGAIWLVVHQLVITEEVYRDIKAKSVADPRRIKSRYLFLGYLTATVLFFIMTLVLAV